MGHQQTSIPCGSPASKSQHVLHGDLLCCCFDQREADQMISGKQFWDSCVLGMSFRVFWVGHKIYFWKHFRLFCLQMLFVCLCMFLYILGCIFKDNISLTTYHMMWLVVRLWLKKKLLSCYGVCLISKCLLKENIHGDAVGNCIWIW